MENKSEEQLLPEERKGRADSKREVFLLAGDFNIDGIPNLEKSSAKFRDQEEFDMTEFVSYYSRAKQLKLERPAVASLLETKSRYTLMMALLNSGRLMVDDLQVEVLDNKLVTYGESATDRETNKVRTRERALTDAGGIVVSDIPGDAAAELLQNTPLARELADAGRAVILSRQGSTKRHAAMLLELLQTRAVANYMECH